MSRDWNKVMFDDIGKKIKGVAKVIVWFEIVLSIIGGIVLFFTAFIDIQYYGWMIFVAPVAVLIGCIVAWLSVIPLYGFGELIDKACEIEQNTQNHTKKLNTRNSKKASKNNSKTNDKSSAKTWSESEADDNDPCTEYIDIFCPACGQELSFIKGTENAECPWCNATINL